MALLIGTTIGSGGRYLDTIEAVNPDSLITIIFPLYPRSLYSLLTDWQAFATLSTTVFLIDTELYSLQSLSGRYSSAALHCWRGGGGGEKRKKDGLVSFFDIKKCCSYLAKAIHLSDALYRIFSHRGFARKHDSICAIDHGIEYVIAFSPRGSGCVNHWFQHLIKAYPYVRVQERVGRRGIDCKYLGSYYNRFAFTITFLYNALLRDRNL